MKKSSFAMRLPKFKFSDTGINGFLVLSLVIFAFVLGMLTNKVIYLQEQLKNPVAAVGANPQQQAPPAPPAVVKGITNGHFPILGNKDAKVTMVEFSDFQCPFCKSFFTDSEKKVIDTYVKTGKIKFAYRQFPLVSIHPNAQKAAEAAECANDQGKFWEFHDIMFANQDTWAPLAAADAAAKFADYAGQVGLDTDQFTSCFESGKFVKNVSDDNADASIAQVDATPTFFINGVRVTGAVPFDQIKQAIDQELKK